MKMWKTKEWLCLAAALVLVGSIAASILQTSFGKVQLKDIYLMTENQQYLHALAFIPKEASEENKVPLVVTSHGWLNSAEVQDAASIELSRRGIAVLAMDAYGHGLSSSLDVNIYVDSTNYGQGMIALVEYATSGIMNYVDTSRIGIMGHSMGGGATTRTAIHYSNLSNEAIEAARSPILTAA